MRKILLLISDTHGGFSLALMNPDVKLTTRTIDGQIAQEWKPQPTEWQSHLWKVYMNGIEDLKRFANDDEILVLHNGDLTDGKKYPSGLVSTNTFDQFTIAASNFAPLMDLPNVNTVRIATGTEAHNLGENTSELVVSNMLQKQYTNKDTQVVTHGLLTYNDLLIDYAHHGPPPGTRNWLKGNVARYYLQSLMQDDIQAGKTPPGLVTRGHVHYPIDERVRIENFVSWLIIAPSFSGLSDYVNMSTRSTSYIVNGMTAVEIIDGEVVRLKPFHKKVDVRRREIL